MRWVWFFLSIVTLLIAWTGPLPELSEKAFFGHMIMHMLNVAIAAPLFSLALAGGKFDLTAKYPLLFAPIPAAVVELIVVWGWHAPLPHHFAREQTIGFIAEQGSFFICGVWLWLSAFGGEGSEKPGVHLRKQRRQGAGIIGLLLTAMHMTFLGALLGLAPRPLYPHHSGYASLGPLEDQHLGGAIMLIVGAIAFLAGGLYLARKMMKPKKTAKLLEAT